MNPHAGGLAALLAIGLLVVVTVVIGSLGVRFARTTSDFLAASRTVGTGANATAISGEYLSAAAFLGIAGLVLKDGPDALWYPVGFAAGYLALLLFVAAPLRRSGAYTIPDFAEARLGSAQLRQIATGFVVVIGWLYVLPQLQAAGLTLTTVTRLPSWAGVLGVGAIMTASVVFGGMRSITFVQAFHYWVKLTAVAVPTFVLVTYLAGSFSPPVRPAPPSFPTATTVNVRTAVTLQVAVPVDLGAHGRVDGVPVDGPLRWAPGRHTVAAGSRLRFTGGEPVPVAAGAPISNDSWVAPLHGHSSHPLLAIYSLIVATFLGTMGLPHVLVRFYTNPDGRAARRTATVVVGLIGAFYVFPAMLGAMSRCFVPQLLVTGRTDAAVLLLPSAVVRGWLGTTLGSLVAAGAFAAFLSTSCGLVASVAGVLSTDVLPGRARDLRMAGLVAGLVPMGLALAAAQLDFAQTVSLAFAVAASSFSPLLVLGIWWRRLTDIGAVVGLLVGGGLAVLAVLTTLSGVTAGGAFGVLLDQPAVVTVPLTFVTMIVVSWLTRRRVPGNVSQILLRLHAPERLGLGPDRVARPVAK